jgi:hypothetical protein
MPVAPPAARGPRAGASPLAALTRRARPLARETGEERARSLFAPGCAARSSKPRRRARPQPVRSRLRRSLFKAAGAHSGFGKSACGSREVSESGFEKNSGRAVPSQQRAAALRASAPAFRIAWKRLRQRGAGIYTICVIRS